MTHCPTYAGERPRADSAEIWQRQVHRLMARGLGVEDIAVTLRCPVAHVRAEADILRAEGRLDALYTGDAAA
jgi:hypothetical protein